MVGYRRPVAKNEENVHSLFIMYANKFPDWIAKSSESNESEWGWMFWVCANQPLFCELWYPFGFHLCIHLNSPCFFLVFSLFSPHASIQFLHIRHESSGQNGIDWCVHRWQKAVICCSLNVHHFYHRYGGYYIFGYVLPFALRTWHVQLITVNLIKIIDGKCHNIYNIKGTCVKGRNTRRPFDRFNDNIINE